MAVLDSKTSATPAGQILEHLLRSGEASIKDLENALGVTATAVRQQLVSLSAEGLITSEQERKGVGRPRNVYRPTERAYSLFACYCDDLALSLIGELLEADGADKLRLLLNRVGVKLGGQYASQIQSEAVGDRVRELSILLDRRGVIVDVEEYPSDGVIVLQEYNCPYHELASVHRDVCEMERDAFSLALQAEVKLGNCIQDGHHSCQFVVSSRPQPTRSALVAG
jgi:predicted ArsR family transcriptional regulator